MADPKPDYANLIEVRRVFDSDLSTDWGTRLGHMAGPRGTRVRDEILRHIESGTTRGSVEVDGATYEFRERE